MIGEILLIGVLVYLILGRYIAAKTELVQEQINKLEIENNRQMRDEENF